MLTSGVASITYRGLTLVSKFLLVIYLGRHASISTLGAYALMTSMIQLSMYIVGLDFYIYSTRELATNGQNQIGKIIKNQFIVHGLIYFATLPAMIFVVTQLIGWSYIPWFIALLIVEHASQEGSRILIALSKPTQAIFSQFLRSGLWVYASIATIIAIPTTSIDTLTIIWIGWLLGAIVSILYIAYTIGLPSLKELVSSHIDKKWIKKGIRMSTPFALSSLGFFGISHFARFILENHSGETAVGIYSFFFNFSSIIDAFIMAGIINVLLPKIIKAGRSEAATNLTPILTKMTKLIFCTCIVLVITLSLGINVILSYVGKTELIENINIFYILLAAAVILCMSHVPHYYLFATHKDNQIIASHIITLVFTTAGYLICIPAFGLQGAAYCYLLGTFLLLALKSIPAYKSLKPHLPILNLPSIK